MKEIVIKQLKNIEEVLLCKINKTPIAELNRSFITSQSRSIDDIDTISLTINEKYMSPFSKSYEKNPYYKDVILERFLCIDEEYYVIKEIKEDKIKGIKEIKAYGGEKKLEKINITLSNVGLSLLDEDINNNVYSFNDYLYKLTGWKLGYVDLTVRYMDNGEPKVRIQEDTDTSIYNFITETIAEQFCCIPIFNRKNKTIDLYNDETFGDELKIVLTKDNYLKSLIKTGNSNDIVTRLKLKGNEEKCIVENETPNGKDYIEDYSYFIETKEMSDELIKAIEVFDYLTPDRIAKWKELTKVKTEMSTKLMSLNASENICQAKMKQLNALITEYDSMETETEAYDLDSLQNTLNAELENSIFLDQEISDLEEKLNNVENKIIEINKLCTRETALDVNGDLIFTPKLLDEFKEFIYYDTYSDDSFIEAKEIIKTGKRKLSQKCRPTIEFDIDVDDFTSRLITNDYYKQWNGVLGLGDVISLYDKENNSEEFVYFVGWEKSYNKNESKNKITLTFSNKKTKKDNSKVISDLLKNTKNNKKIIGSNKWLWNNQKYNRVDDNFVDNYDFTFDEPVIIKKYAVTGVKLNTSFLNLNIGDTYLLEATIEPENASNKNIIWASSDPLVATIDNGYVKGLSKGICTIGVMTEDGNKTASTTVNVGGYVGDYVAVKSLSANLPKNVLNINESMYMVSIVTPSNATNKEVMYSSSNTSVVKINNEGLITGVAPGGATITMVSLDNQNVIYSAYITVTNTETVSINYSLKNALVLGGTRIKQLKDYNLLTNCTVEATDNVTPSYFYKNNIIDKYSNSDFSCLVLMTGECNPSGSSLIELKLLVEKLKEKFPSKNIYILQELLLGVGFDNTLSTYKNLNDEISKYNETINIYCKDTTNCICLDCSDTLINNNLLDSEYSIDGFRLNKVGGKILVNNIEKAIYDYGKALEEAKEKEKENATVMYVTATTLSIREGEGDEYDVLDTLSYGSRVRVASKSVKWAKILYGDDFGYVLYQYLSLNDPNQTSSNTMYVIVTSLNVRAGEGTTYSILGTLSYGDSVKVISTNSGWAKIVYKDSESGYAYVYDEYLISENPNDNDYDSDDEICEERKKIVARAEEIYKMKVNGKAWYSNNYRTIHWNHKNKITGGEYAYGAWRPHTHDIGKYGFDCSSLVGVCYEAPGYDFMAGLSCSGGSLCSTARKHKCITWKGKGGVSKAKPGDIVMYANNSVSNVSDSRLTYVSTHHTAIYIGNGYIIEANGYSEGILRRKRPFDNTSFFIRINELTEADKKVVKKPKITTDDNNDDDETIDTIGNTPNKLNNPLWGIDVSYHNGTIDFQKVKNAGVKFVILRCGYASSSNRTSLSKDTKFETYYKDCKSVGLPVGTYFYSRCNSISTAQAEADFILNTIKDKQFEYPVWLDVEDTKNTLAPAGKTTMTNAVVKCMTEIKNAGYRVGIYTGKEQLTSYLKDESPLKDFDYWIASWTNSCVYEGEHYMWQFGGETNKLKDTDIPGVGSDVADQNYVYVDYPSFIKAKGLNGYEKQNYITDEDKTVISKEEGKNCFNESGTKDGHKYIYKFTNARCTCYGGNANNTPGGKSIAGATFACHNMPYGTRIYIPELKGKFGNSSGIWTARDTGGYCFDLDLYLSSTDDGANSKFSKYYNAPIYTTLYVLSWGDGKCSPSFSYMVKVCDKYYNLSSFHSAWKQYMKYGGCTINFTKFNSDDKTFKNNSWYSRL